MTPASRKYSTAAASPAKRVALWRSYMAEVYYDLDIAPRDRDQVSGAIRELELGSIGISSVQTSAQRVTRRKGSARTDGLDAFVLIFSRRGTYEVRQGRNTGTFEPGDVFLINASEFYQTEVPDLSDNITLTLPGHLLRSRLGRVDDLCAKEAIADRALRPIVQRFGSDLLSMAVLNPQTAERLECVCLDLVATMLDAGRRASEGGRQSAELPSLLVSDLRAFIENHLGDPTLMAEDAARACGISTRFVQRLFQQQNTTFNRELMAARLHRADRLLRAGEGERMPIGEIAYACGFVSQAHFSARFRQAFGRTPRDVRAEPSRP